MINNFYDVELFGVEEYKKLRKIFKTRYPDKEDDFGKYRKELSSLEKHRPIPSVYHQEGDRD